MITDNIRKSLFECYPQFTKYIESKCKILDTIYDEYLNDLKFSYDLQLDKIKDNISEETVNECIEFDKNLRGSEFGTGDHIVKYIGSVLEELIMELDTKQNLKDFDN